MKLSGPYPTMYNRDEIFFRLGIEKSAASMKIIMLYLNLCWNMGWIWIRRKVK